MSDIRIIHRKEVDIQRWDALVSGPVSVFSKSWYLDAVCPDWHAMVLGDYEAIMAAPFRTKGGFRSFYQPFFSRELAVFGKGDPKVFLDLIREQFHLSGFGFSAEGPSDGFKTETYIHQWIELPAAVEEQHKAYSTNTKRMLKRAAKGELKVRPLTDPAPVWELFRNEKAGEFGHLKAADLGRLHQIMLNANAQGALRSFGGYVGDDLVAGATFILNDQTLLYLKGAVSDDGKEVGGMFSVMDAGISMAIKNGCSLFDFGGSRNEGLAGFNRKFGATDRKYLFLSHDRLPVWARIARKIKR